MSQRIRLANESDAAALHSLLQQAYAPLVAQDIHFTITRASVAEVREVIRSESTYVLENESGLIATLTTRFPWTAAKNHLAPWPFVHWFAVAEQAKGQGLGREIIRYVEEAFLRDTLKAPAVYLATAIRHPWLTDLYLRRGYQPFHTAINPLGVELVYLRKILDRQAFADQEHKPIIRPLAELRAGLTA